MYSTVSYQRLYHRIDEGVGRFKVASETAKLRLELKRNRIECKGASGAFLNTFFRLKFESASTQDTADALRAILSRSRLPQYVVFDALYLLARMTLHVDTLEQNEKYRQRALDIAIKNRWRPQIFRVLVNWAFALIESDRSDKAAQRVQEAEVVLSQMTPSEKRSPEVHQLRSRLLAHTAKILLFGDKTQILSSATKVIPSAIRLYNEAIAIVQEQDHLRVNQQIEFCEYIVKCYERLDLPRDLDFALGQAESIIAEAERSLDSHNCDNCRAYFGEVFSRLLFVNGKRIAKTRAPEAEALWDKAVVHASESLTTFERVGHVEARVPRQTIQDIATERARLPRKVFLSHSSKDKLLIRQFKILLEKLHYEPWLDEDHLKAGDKLEKGLLEGIQSSCAVVFFITANFFDNQYLETEIEYTIAERRNRGDSFRIVALVFPNGSGARVQVPDLLKPYVYKNIDQPLDALRYIIESLPFEPGIPVLKR